MPGIIVSDFTLLMLCISVSTVLGYLLANIVTLIVGRLYNERNK